MMARIRDAENTQCVAELTQKISNLEYKNQEMATEGDLATSIGESDRMRELQDKVACLRAQTNNFQLPTPACTPLVEYKLFLPYKQDGTMCQCRVPRCGAGAGLYTSRAA